MAILMCGFMSFAVDLAQRKGCTAQSGLPSRVLDLDLSSFKNGVEVCCYTLGPVWYFELFRCLLVFPTFKIPK